MFDKKRIEKKKTQVKDKTLDPQFNETFVFNVSSELIHQTCLSINVMDYGRIKQNESIGSVILSSQSGPTETKHWKDMCAKPRQPIAQWHVLKDLS